MLTELLSGSGVQRRGGKFFVWAAVILGLFSILMLLGLAEIVGICLALLM